MTSLGDLTDVITNYTEGYMYLGQGSGNTSTLGPHNNTGLGMDCMPSVTGVQNVAVGNSALTAATGSSFNVAIGYEAMLASENTENNVAIGNQALPSITDGFSVGNVAVGYGTLSSLATGTNNVAIGQNTGGTLVTGDNNILIGHDADVPTSTTGDYLNINNWIAGPSDAINISGNPTTTTQSPLDNSTSIATTEYVDSAVTAAAIVLTGYISGCLVTNNAGTPNTMVDIASGMAADSTGNSYIKSAGYTVDFSSSGAVNKLDTGTIAASTWYHVFVIAKPDGTTGGLASLSATAPTLPSGYTVFKRVGSVLTNSAVHILGFKAAYTGGGTTEIFWSASVLDVNTTTLGTSSTTFALTVPSGVTCVAILQHFLFTANIVNIRCLDQPDEAPSATAAPCTSHGCAGSGANQGAGHIRVRTNTSRQVAMRSDGASTKITAATLGWLDYRGT